MDIYVDFEVIDYNSSEKYTLSKVIQTDIEFKDSTSELKFKDGDGNEYEKKFHRTIEYNADDFILNMDKTKFMMENNISTIIDWEVKKVGKSLNLVKVQKEIDDVSKLETKKQMNVIFDYFTRDNKSDKSIKDDMVAVYMKMFDSIYELPLSKQLDIIFSGLSVAYKSASNAYDNMSKLLKSDTVEEMSKLINNENKKFLNEKIKS